MITPSKGARFLERQNVGRLFHYAKQIVRSRFVAANVAKLLRRKKAAKFAGANLSPRFRNRGGDLFRLIVARLNHPQCDAFGRARPDSRHLPQMCDQIANRLWIFRSFQTSEFVRLARDARVSLEHNAVPSAPSGHVVRCSISGFPNMLAYGPRVCVPNRAVFHQFSGCRRFHQMQGERFEAAQIKIEGCILFVVWSAGLLEFVVGLGPALLAIQHNAVPKRIASSH